MRGWIDQGKFDYDYSASASFWNRDGIYQDPLGFEQDRSVLGAPDEFYPDGEYDYHMLDLSKSKPKQMTIL